MVGTGFGGERFSGGVPVHCPKCSRYFTPTPREAEAVVRGEPVPLCPGCYVARAFRVFLLGCAMLILLGAILCSLPGCAIVPGTWGDGPRSDGEQQELDRIRRERGASKVSQREAEHALQRMIGSR